MGRLCLRLGLINDGHRDGAAGRGRETSSQNLDAVIRHQKGVLELRRERPIGRGAGPVVGPRAITVGSGVDHRLNGEAHTRFGGTHGLVLAIVGNVRSAVEQLVDTVTAVALDDAAVAALGMFLNHISGISEKHAGLHQLDGFVQTLSRSFDDANGLRVRAGLVSNIVGFVKIAVVAVVVQSHVDVDNVTILERSLVGDAVADGLVDRGADGLGEIHVVQGRGIGLDRVQYHRTVSRMSIVRGADAGKSPTSRSMQALCTTSSM